MRSRVLISVLPIHPQIYQQLWSAWNEWFDLASPLIHRTEDDKALHKFCESLEVSIFHESVLIQTEPPYVTGSAKTGLIAMTVIQFFSAKTRQCTIKFHCQNEVALGGLLLLATFFPAHWQSVQVAWVHHGALVGR